MQAELIKAIAVTAELTGTELSEAAARVFAEDLSGFPLPQVLGALVRCRREVKGRLSLSDVITRLEDGRPGAEEAWTMIPRNEAESVVWTDEMRSAFAAAGALLAEGDAIAARMAFKEKYSAEVQKARNEGVPAKWILSAGHDPAGRKEAITQATAKGLIAQDRAVKLLERHCGGDGVESVRALEAQHVSALLPQRKGEAA